jgi:hypothetical protein
MADGPVTIKVRGVKQLEAGARQLFENIERAEASDAIDPTTEQVAATIRARVPRKSGRLAATVHAVRAVNGRGHVTLGAGLPYGRWIEFGAWGGRSPRAGRYVYPTAKRTERAFRKHAEAVCSAQIGGMHWPTPH